MTPHEGIALVTLAAIVAYGIFGGADFGGGLWDLCASGPRKAAQRRAIAHAIGPVWEANHVWLIFVIVLLFAAFPVAFSSLCIALFVPFHLALVGITLRGAAFVFRSYGPKDQAVQQHLSLIFGVSSAITPVVLGLILGAVSSGQVRITSAGPRPFPWTAPLPFALGVLSLLLCAYLAAVFLTVELAHGNDRDKDPALLEDFRKRALLAGTGVVAMSALLLPLLYQRTPHLWTALLGPRVRPVLLVGTVAALGAGYALWQRRYLWARAFTLAQVACLLIGWGLAQAPYLIYPDVRLDDGMAPVATVRFLLWCLPVGAILLLPSLWFLFRVFKGQK